jgi:polar amino acid transport system substrate-binding protein/cystine transport system substrate-binding protein/membrane-bound lytic murein transglycosylase F
LLETIADRLGVRLLINANSAIGRDFNPRNWRVNRGQCEVLAGGVVGSELTRSFLDTTPAYLETGWAAVARDPSLRLEGARVGFFSGVSGLDRIALSRYLRARDTNVQIVTSAEALLDGLRAGRFDFAVSEALTARRIAGPLGLRATWLPGALDRYPIVLGLWKGDLTLKRRLSEVLGQLEREGVIAELARRYAITAIETLAAR